MDNNFTSIEPMLEQASNDVTRGNIAEAVDGVSNIGEVINFLHVFSNEKVKDSENAQIEIAALVAGVIKGKTMVKDQLDEAYRSRDDLNSEMEIRRLEQQQLNDDISNLNRNIGEYKRELARQQGYLDELNDTSAASIILSILSLGLDRAVKGISVLVNDTQGKIDRANADIARLQTEIARSQDRIREIELGLAKSREQQHTCIETINALQASMDALQQKEEQERVRLVYFTKISLYYRQLNMVAREIDDKIHDLPSVVDRLNSEEVDIIIEEGGEQVIFTTTLKVALEKFDKYLP